MVSSRYLTTRCAAGITISLLLLLLLLTLNWGQTAIPTRLPQSANRSRISGSGRIGGSGKIGGSGEVTDSGKIGGSGNIVESVGGGGGIGRKDCPPGRFVTISALGRLGNNICQYASLWALQKDDPRARPAWLLPDMHCTLAPLFNGLSLPTLSESCAKRSRQFRTENYRKFDQIASRQPQRPLLLSSYPCDLDRFHRHREALLQQLTFRPTVLKEAQRRLRGYTAALCRGQPGCTYIGVHVRRTDFARAVVTRFNGTLVGETYLRRALALCRRRYRRPVFLVSSDDLNWVRRRLKGPDVVIAGSEGAGSAGRDLALLAQCNHTVMTLGTYGFWAAYLAGGDVIVPTGFGDQDSYLSVMMKKKGLNVTMVSAF